MSAVDVKAYLVNEDFRLAYTVEYWENRWKESRSIPDYDAYIYHLQRYKQFTEFRKAVLAAFDISE